MSAPRTPVGLFGGTFDPFHNGHLRMAIEIREKLPLARVVVFPCNQPPHKPSQPVSDAAHRLAMIASASAGLDWMDVSDIEIRREGPSYSLLTVREFRRSEPSCDPVFIMGADSFAELSTWHRYEEFLQSCDLVLLPRSGASASPAPPEGIRIEKVDPRCYSWEGSVYSLPGGRRLFCPSLPALDISSRSIREKVRTGKCIRGLVPPEVERYIHDHGLYLDPREERRP